MITETLVAATARNITTPLITGVLNWLGERTSRSRPQYDSDVLSLAWQDVGACLDKAMGEYPLEQAPRHAVGKFATDFG